MFDKVIQDIAEFNITGAEKITLWGVRAFAYRKSEIDEKCQFISTYMVHLSKAKKQLFESRKNEFSLHNALNYIFDKKRYSKAQTLEEVQKDVQKRIETVENHLEEAIIRIAQIGSIKLKAGMSIATIGNSTFVEEIISRTSEKKKIEVNIFQGGPEEKGKELIYQLPKKQKVTYYSDAMMAEVLDKTDIVLLGATGITQNGECITQAGAKTMVELANSKNIPVYIATDSLKFAKELIIAEEKPIEELWIDAPRNVLVHNPSTSTISAKNIEGIICEKGIFRMTDFISEAKKTFF